MVESKKQSNAYALGLMMVVAAIMMPNIAFAGGEVIANVLCEVVNWFTGPVGTGIATLAIIVIGVGALMGKVSWGMAIIVGVGVAVVFGAGELVSDLGGNDACTAGIA